jgi:hypothetical protein
MSIKDNSPNQKNFFKSNYLDVMKIITPTVYFDEDFDLSGLEVNPINKILNTHLVAANNIGTIFTDLSATTNFQNPDLSSLSGITPYFVKQNNLTRITPFDFETKILNKLNKSFNNFETSGEYINYVSGTLLSSIQLGDPSLVENTASAFGELDGNGDLFASAVHEYLVDNLSWFYILNTSADGGLAFDPSSAVLSALGTKLYSGQTLELVDAMECYTEYVWRNYETCSTFSSLGLIPSDFVSSLGDSVDSASATYTSGTQNLDRLFTLLGVLYSPLQFDVKDTKVKDAFENFITLGINIEDEREAAPFTRLLEAMGFFIADLQDNAEKINLIYDTEKSPDFLLPYVAELIGWRFFGHDPQRWRMQLKDAVDIYKAAGTKKAIQYVVNATLGPDQFDVSSSIDELWESYVPHLAYYALATESKAFKDLNTWTPEVSKKLGIPEYNTSSIDENIKLAVDYIILDLVTNFKNHFRLGNDEFPDVRSGYKRKDNDEVWDGDFHVHSDGSLWTYSSHSEFQIEYELEQIQDEAFQFFYRGRTFPIPPFEKYKYYKNVEISEELLKRFVFKLKCFGVRAEFADQVGEYIKRFTIKNNDTYTYTNDWLFFTSSLQVPDNFNLIIDNLSNSNYKSLNRREDYLSLWNGKSSHVSMLFDASTFDFNNLVDLNGQSSQAIYQTGRAVKEFMPAHVIPNIAVVASSTDDYIVCSVPSPILMFDSKDSPAGYASALEASGASLGIATGRIGVSGIDLESILGDKFFKRGEVVGFTLCEDSPIRMKLTNVPGKDDYGERGSLFDDEKRTPLTSFSGLAAIGTPRNSYRRRSFKNVLPKQFMYHRTGYNMPTTWEASSFEDSLDEFVDDYSGLGFLALGYIPSAGTFEMAEDVNNLHAVWDICETLDSSNVFFDVPTSGTFNCRGTLNVDSNVKYGHEIWTGASSDYYVDRCKYDPFLGTIWSLQDRKDYYQASADLADASAQLLDHTLGSNAASAYGYWITSSSWLDIITSYQNSATLNNGWGLNSIEDYENFSFGVGIHRIFDDYTKKFGQHNLNQSFVTPDGGADIFSHTYGPLIYNGRFNIEGPLHASGISSHPSSITVLDYNTSGQGGRISASGISSQNYWAYTTSSIYDMGVPVDGKNYYESKQRQEYRNFRIVSGVELVLTAPASANYVDPKGLSEFAVLKFDNRVSNIVSDNYLIDNTLIKCKAIDGFPRVRFDLWNYGHRANPTNPAHVVNPVYNTLLPNHTFDLNVKSLISNEKVTKLGDGTIGVWIHTGMKDGKTWSWTKNNKWEESKVEDLNSNNVIADLAHTFYVSPSSYDDFGSDSEFSNETCVDQVLVEGDNSFSSFPEGLLKLNNESFFNNHNIIFNTINQKIAVPAPYFSEHLPNIFGTESSATTDSLGGSGLESSSLNFQNWIGSEFEAVSPPGIADTSVVTTEISIPLNEIDVSSYTGVNASAVSSIYAVWDNDAASHLKLGISFNPSSFTTREIVNSLTFSYYFSASSINGGPGPGSRTEGMNLPTDPLPDTSYKVQLNFDTATSAASATDGTNVGSQIPTREHFIRLEKVDDNWYKAYLSLWVHKDFDEKFSQLRIYPAGQAVVETGGTFFFGPKLTLGHVGSAQVFESTVVPRQRNQIHHEDQKYYVEVFMVPSRGNIDKFMLLDEVTMIDMTQNTRARIKLQGGEHREEPFVPKKERSCSGILEVPVNPEELRQIFKYFNSLARGSQSRDSTLSQSSHDTSGGSRLSYREHPEWSPHIKTAGTEHYTELDIIN